MPQDEPVNDKRDDGPGAADGGQPPLRVGSWPGYESRYNPFVGNFLDGLRAAGCRVVSLPDPAAFAGAEVDVLILHWVDRLFWTAKGNLDLFRRITGFLQALWVVGDQTRIVWLVHNLAPHDARPLRKWAWRQLLPVVARRTDAVLTLSPGTVDQVRRAIPGLARCPAFGTQHPAYRLAPAATAAAGRRDFGLPPDARVIGYAGNLRPYKGLDQLVAAFRQLPSPDLRLFLAGSASTQEQAELAALAAGDPRIRIEARRLDAAEFDAGLLACDLIVAPFHDYLHSGSMVHALSAGRPLLTPDTPFARSLAEQAGAVWVATYGGPLTASVLDGALGRRPESSAPDLAAFQPHRVGQEVAAFLREVSRAPRLARRRGGQTSAWLRRAGFQ